MKELIREIEGTWEEVAAQGAQFAGRRVRLTLLDGQATIEEVVVPSRPAPTPEQAALGILPAAIGNGTYTDIMRIVRELHGADDEQEDSDLWEAISENRAQRRKAAEVQD